MAAAPADAAGLMARPPARQRRPPPLLLLLLLLLPAAAPQDFDAATPAAEWEDGTVTPRGLFYNPQQAIVLPVDRKSDDFFGTSVAMDRKGDRALVGAIGVDAAGSGAGAVFVYDRTWCSDNFGYEFSCWVLSFRLLSYTGFLGTAGCAVSISDDGGTALVGALGDGHDSTVMNAGAAYLWGIDARTQQWTQLERLRAADAMPNDFFGCSVALSQNATVIVAGARGADLPDQMDGGAAYVFTQGVEEWEQQKLVAPDGRDYTSFGRSVAIRGNMILVGADGWGETAEQENTGRVYIFTRDMVRPIGPNGTGTAYCGNGLPQYEAVDYSECVYGRNYSFYQVLVPFDRDTPAQRFGVSLSLSDFGLSLHTGILAVGAYEYSTLTAKQSGRVYIYKWGEKYDDFDNMTMEWNPKQILKPDFSVNDDFFGKRISVSPDGSVIIVGAAQAEGASGRPSNGGVGFLFVRAEDGKTWSQVKRMTPFDAAPDDLFGSSVAVNVDGSVAMIGATRADDPFYTDTECARVRGGCGNTGAGYSLSGKCPEFQVAHSNRDGGSVYRRECFSTINQQCIAICDPGWRGVAPIVTPSRGRTYYHQYAVSCTNLGVFHAEWDGMVECFEVRCPANTHPNTAKTNCTCDDGFDGRIWWEPQMEVWNGTCAERPCAPVYIPLSDRAAGNEYGPCRGGTLDPCFFTCSPGYKCSSAFGGCSWYASSTLCGRDGFFQAASCVPAGCPQFSTAVSLYDPSQGCECIENYEGDIYWERVTEGWRGVCEGEWVVAERARAGLFEFIGVVCILATIGLCILCGGRKYRDHRRLQRALELERRYLREKDEAERGRIKQHHKLENAEDLRIERERRRLTKMEPEEAQLWWDKVTAREVAAGKNRKKQQSRWQTAVHKQLWRNGKVAEGGKPTRILYEWQQGEIGDSRGVGALAECKLRYGSTWGTMSKEEKQLILYRFDKDYIRPTSTNGWVKPEAKEKGGSPAEIFPVGLEGGAADGSDSERGAMVPRVGNGGGEDAHPLQITDATDDVAAAWFLAN